jgi:hypothetical protein
MSDVLPQLSFGAKVGILGIMKSEEIAKEHKLGKICDIVKLDLGIY